MTDTSATSAGGTTTRTVLIIGATSGIGRAIAHEWASNGYTVILAGRDRDELISDAADIHIRHGVQASTLGFDALKYEDHGPFFHAATNQTSNGLDTIIVCHGYLPAQTDAETDFEIARRTIDVNYTSAISILNLAAAYFLARGRGTICGVSSVAGDRGRQSNFIYGSAKAALSTYLAGLRHRLARHGVKVVNVKPGFVDTGMTWGLPGLFLVASPTQVAHAIWRACAKGKSVAYVPGFWRFIMLIIRSVPDFLFMRTKL